MVISVHFSDGRVLQRLLHQLAAPAADGLRQPVRHLAAAGQLHLVEPRHRRPRGHPRRHRDSTAGLQLHRPVGRAQRELLRLLRQRHRRPVHGSDSVATLGEDACAGAPSRRSRCARRTPTARLSPRYMLNGNDFDDYLRRPRPGRSGWPSLLGRITRTTAACTCNSAIWNNALWTIRSQLAKIDNQPGIPVAAGPRLRPDRLLHADPPARAELLDGRRGQRRRRTPPSRPARSPTIIRIAREVFDQQDLCPGCHDPGAVAGDIVEQQAAGRGQPGRVRQEHRLDQPRVGGPGTPSVSGGARRPTR